MTKKPQKTENKGFFKQKAGFFAKALDFFHRCAKMLIDTNNYGGFHNGIQDY